MNKPRKYNGVYKLPIKKHTKVRRPISRWVLDGDKKCIWYKDTFDIFNNAHKLQGRRSPVQDISKGLENPLNLVPPFKPFGNDIMGDWGKDMEKQWYDNMKSVKEEDFGGLFDEPVHTGYLSKYRLRHPIVWFSFWNATRKSKPSLLTRVKERFKR